jgi:hypothetical protein
VASGRAATSFTATTFASAPSTTVAPPAREAGADESDPVAAARDIDEFIAQLAARTAAGTTSDTTRGRLHDVVAPGTAVWEASAAELAPPTHAPGEYELQSNDGTRAHVFADHGSTRRVLTLLRWEGHWKLAAIVVLHDAPPLVILTGAS